MAVTVTIDGVDRSSYVKFDTLMVNMGHRSTWTAEFTVNDRVSTSSAFRPDLSDTVVIADGATTIFRGWVFGVQDSPVSPPADGTSVRVSCRSYDALLDSIIVDRVYGTDPIVIANSSVANPTTITTVQPHGYNNGASVVIDGHVGGVAGINGTHVATVTSHSTFTIPVNNTTSGGGGTVREVNRANTIVTELHSAYLNGRGVSLDTLSDAAYLYKQVYDGVTLRQVLDSIAEQTGWIYRITPSSPQLQFFAPGAKTLGYSLTFANNLAVGPVTWEQRRERYVNTITLLYGGTDIRPQTDVITGDGSTAQWVLRYTALLDVYQFVVSAGVVNEAGVHYPVSPLFDIVSSSVANPTTIVCERPHGLSDAATVTIQAHSGSTPSINGSHTATVTGPFTFTIPVNVTVAGTGGTGYNAAHTWFWYAPLNMLTRISNLASETVATFIYQVQYPQRIDVEDAGEVAANGVWAGRFSAPDVFDVDAATTIAEGILRRELAQPKIPTVATRQGFVMPGDAATLTYADRTISGTHIVQSVKIGVDGDVNLRYTLTAVTGNEFKDQATDLLRDALLGTGGVRAAGGTISGAAVPGSADPISDGLFPGRVVAHLGRSGDYTGSDGWQFESALDYYLDSSTIGPALRLGSADEDYAWAIVADTLAGSTPGSVPRLKFTPAIEGPSGQAAMVLMQHLSNTGEYFLIPGPGGVNAFSLGDQAGGTTAGTPVPITNVYTTDCHAVDGYSERGRSVLLGDRVAVAHSAGNFTASAGSWTVDSGDQLEYTYSIHGKTMTVWFTLTNTDVSNAGAVLRLAVPGGFTIATGANQQNLMRHRDAGAAAAVGVVYAQGGVTYLQFFSDLAGTTGFASTSSDNTDIIGQISFSVA